MKIICGLGNPGSEYEDNRHNVGFRVIDGLCKSARSNIRSVGFEALGFLLSWDTEKVLCLQPQTFMNDSGRSLSAAARFYKVSPEDMLVIHDELDLPLGKLQVKLKGGAGGHNGLKSIISCLETDAFPRLRFGIAKPDGAHPEAVIHHVLSNFSSRDRAALLDLIDDAQVIAQSWVKNGTAWTMNQFNRKKDPAPPD